MNRRPFLAAGLAAALPMPALAQGSAAPIRVIVPFTPGGPTDILGRIVAQGIASVLGRSAVVENRAGAGGSIGAELVVRAAPNGDTVLVGTLSTQVLNKGLFQRLSYDPVADFVPIALLGEVPLVGATYPTFPATTLAEFIGRAKAAPGTLSYSTPGNGSAGHIAMAMFCQRVGIDMLHVPFRGTAPATAEVIGGRVSFTFETIASGYQMIRDGALKVLGVTSERRLPQLPSAPTFLEAGVNDYVAQTWVALLAPPGTPAGIVAEMNAAAQRTLDAPETRQRLDALGLVLPDRPMSSNDVRAYIEREAARWLPVIASTGARAD